MKEKISDGDQNRIIARLEELNVGLPCPRCGSTNFTLSDGYNIIPVRADIKGITIGGRAIPCITTVCTHCGYVSMHSLGILGLMDMAKGQGDSEVNEEQDRN